MIKQNGRKAASTLPLHKTSIERPLTRCGHTRHPHHEVYTRSTFGWQALCSSEVRRCTAQILVCLSETARNLAERVQNTRTTNRCGSPCCRNARDELYIIRSQLYIIRSQLTNSRRRIISLVTDFGEKLKVQPEEQIPWSRCITKNTEKHKRDSSDIR